MPTTINRTAYNALVNDDGSNLVGSFVDKDFIKNVLLDPIDGALALSAPLASPALTGVPTAPTAAPGSSTTQLATTAFVAAIVAALAEASISGLVADLALKAPLASPALTGTPTVPTAAPGVNTTQAASTAFVAAVQALLAPLASPTFTGTPAAPTAAVGVNTTQLATMAALFAGQMRCSAFNAGAQAVANATITVLTFDSEDFDANGFHSTVTNTSRFTVPAGGGGTFLCFAECWMPGNATGAARNLYIAVNGTSIDKVSYPPSANAMRPQILTVVTVVAGDYIEAQAYQDSTASMNVGLAASGPTVQNRLVIIKVG